MSPRIDRRTTPRSLKPQQISLAWKDLLHGMLSALYEAHPIALYQLVVFIRHPSWVACAMVLLSLALNHIAIEIAVAINLLRTRRKLIRGCLAKMTDCTFTRYPVSEFLGGAYESVENSPVRQMMRRVRAGRASVNERIQIYVVTTTKPVHQLSCYAGPYFVNSFVFLNDIPAEIRSLGRFFILHEIGHSQMVTFAQPSGLRLWVFPQIFLFLWIAVTGTWSTAALPIAMAYLSTVLLWWQDWNRRMTKQRFLDELLADYFALNYLPARDLAMLRDNKCLSSLRDEDLTPLQNTIRIARLRENIDLALRGDLTATARRTFSELTTPRWRVVLAATGITAMTGLLGAPPKLPTLLWMLALGVGLSLGLALLIARIVKGDMRITDWLHERRPGATSALV